MIAVHAQNQVVSLPTLGDIFACVVDDVARTQRAYQVHMSRAAYGSDVRSEELGKLHGECADTTRRPMNQDSLSRLNASGITQRSQRSKRRDRDGRCRLERHIGWFQ